MKRSLLSLLILASSYTNAQSVDNLNIQESSGRPVYITGYDLDNKYMTLNFKVTDSMNVCWYGSGKNIPFIIDDNSKKSSLIGVDNVTYCPERMSMNSGDTFSVKFVAPSDNAKTFSLFEGECALNYKEGCWRFENIPLNHQSEKSEYSVTKKDLFYIENNKLTKADLKDYSKGQLRLLRNHFFAKKGYAFKEGSDLDIFFKKFSWYSPKEILSTDIYENQLTEQEKNNISLLWAVEKGESVEQVSKEEKKVFNKINKLNQLISEYESFKYSEKIEKALRIADQALSDFYENSSDYYYNIYHSTFHEARKILQQRVEKTNEIIDVTNKISYDEKMKDEETRAVYARAKALFVIEEYWNSKQRKELDDIYKRFCQHSRAGCR